MSFTFTTSNSFDQAGPIGGGAIAPGWYQAIVTEATETQSKASGKPMIDMTLQVAVSRTRTIDVRHCCLVLTTAAAWKIEQFLAATGKLFAKGEEITISAQEVEGKRLWVQLYNEPDRDEPEKLYARVDAFLRKENIPHPGAMTAEELEEYGLTARGVKRKLSEQLALNAEVHRRQEQTRQNIERVHANKPLPIPHEDDDDIPF